MTVNYFTVAKNLFPVGSGSLRRASCGCAQFLAALPLTDGSALIFPNCINDLVRGGSWIVWQVPQTARSASRDNYAKDNRRAFVGFRVARTLIP
jgi:formylglycine-generating enzyme required for sulfatase activity